jgi:hypothetical protein
MTAPVVPTTGALQPLGVDDVRLLGGFWGELGSPTTWPYGGRPGPDGRAATVTLVPYHLWANRGPATMRIWLPEEA